MTLACDIYTNAETYNLFIVVQLAHYVSYVLSMTDLKILREFQL